jgi:hypothetical protein
MYIMYVCILACMYLCLWYFYKLSMSMGNVLWVVCVKENMVFEFQRLSTFVFFFVFHKQGRIWSYPSFEDLPAYIILWSHNDWCKFSSISEILTYAILECLKVNKNKMFRVEITLSGMTSLFSGIQIYLLVRKLLRGEHGRTDRQECSRRHYFPFQGKYANNIGQITLEQKYRDFVWGN